MQRRKSSRIVSSDFPTLGGRNQGTYILQSHGTNVSRGDLITQDNIIPDPEEPENLFTITINKNNFSQLCTVGNPGQLVGYTFYQIGGSVTTDADGIYASNCGTGDIWHGPVFYVTLPQQIGKSGQYWHVVYKYTAQNQSDGYILKLSLRVGFSTCLSYDDAWSTRYSGALKNCSIYNVSTNSTLYNVNSAATSHADTMKFYHYENNTIKFYINGELKYSGYDPITLNKGDNMLTVQISQQGTYSVPYHRIQEITISTDPSYDPQP